MTSKLGRTGYSALSLTSDSEPQPALWDIHSNPTIRFSNILTLWTPKQLGFWVPRTSRHASLNPRASSRSHTFFARHHPIYTRVQLYRMTLANSSPLIRCVSSLLEMKLVAQPASTKTTDERTSCMRVDEASSPFFTPATLSMKLRGIVITMITHATFLSYAKTLTTSEGH